jgi:hypothetical protein
LLVLAPALHNGQVVVVVLVKLHPTVSNPVAMGLGLLIFSLLEQTQAIQLLELIAVTLAGVVVEAAIYEGMVELVVVVMGISTEVTIQRLALMAQAVVVVVAIMALALVVRMVAMES